MRRGRLLACVAGLALAAPASAHAAEPLRLTEAAGPRFPDRLYALTLPRPRALGLETVQVSENGRRVGSLSVLPASGRSAQRFGVVLAIDASGSMRGRPLRAAVTAARRFVRRRDPGQPVAVLTFGGQVHLVQPLTTDTGAIERALGNVAFERGGSHVLDATAEAVELLRVARSASGSVVLLSDGGDRGSATTLDRVTAAARSASVRVYGIGLRSHHDDFGTLNLLAAGTRAEFSSATSVSDLIRIYDRLGSRLASQYLIGYRSSAGPATRVRVDVRVAGLADHATADYETPRVPTHVSAPFQRTPAETLWRSPGAFLLVSMLAALIVVAGLLAVMRPRGRSLRARMTAYVGEPSEDSELERPGPRVLVGAARSLDRSSWGTRLAQRLEIAGVAMPLPRLVAWVAVSTVVMAFVLSAAGGPVFGLVALVVPFATWSVISGRLQRQQKLFAEQLPDNLEIIASAMRAGHSFSAALGVVVEDAPEPTRRELQRVIADERLGVPIDEALQAIVERMASRDLEQVALVAALQRETGGNTAEVLDRVTETVRERLALRRTIKTLTAQGRMSRWVVSALPFALLGLITLINPDYMRPLFETDIGHLLLIFAAVMVVAGSLVIKRIVEIKV